MSKSVVPQGYKRTDAGIIPKDWDVSKFGEIAALRKEKVDPRKAQGGLFCIELEHISQGDGRLLGFTETTQQSSLKSSFKKGDVLFGKLRAYLRKYLIAQQDGVCSTEIWAITPKGGRSLPAFIYQIVQTDDFIEAASLAYGTHMPRSDWNVVGNLPIAFPDINEQRVIAEALDDVDALLSAQEQMIAKKRGIKQATMQQLLSGQIRLPDFDRSMGRSKKLDTGVVPSDWDVKSYGDLFDFLSTANNSRADLVEDGEVEYIHYGDIHTKWDNFIDFSKTRPPCIAASRVKNASLIREGDLIVADASEDYTGIAKSIEVRNMGDHKAVAGLHTYLLREKAGALVNGFKGYIHNIKAVKTAIDRVSTGLKVYGVSKNNLKEVLIPVPSKEEQEAIVQVLSDMDSEIAALESERDKTKALKQGMMQELLTGKTRLI